MKIFFVIIHNPEKRGRVNESILRHVLRYVLGPILGHW